ncbi:MAG: polyprenyl diphosphate synthase [Spirochaetales bacterium]
MNIFKNNEKLLNKDKMPRHIAFIIDGNGRWANRRGLPRTVGHKYGVEAVGNTIKNCTDLGIKYMSFYVFSTENCKRPKDEVDTIFDLLREYIKKDISEYKNRDIKLMTSGDLSALPKDIADEIRSAVEKTKECNNFVVNIAINYGGRAEILKAINDILKDGINSVDETLFKDYLYTKDLPDPDLIIRTSGEHRTSNFMPYQAVYSEWHFPRVLWPDFNKKELIKSLLNYQSRNRRFGNIKTDKR